MKKVLKNILIIASSIFALFIVLGILATVFSPTAESIRENAAKTSYKDMQKAYKKGQYELAMISYNSIKEHYADTKIYPEADELYNQIFLIIKEREDNERIEKERQEQENLEKIRLKEEAKAIEQNEIKKNQEAAITALANKTVYIASAKSKLFHDINCRTLKSYSLTMTRKQALEKGYGTCKVCRP